MPTKPTKNNDGNRRRDRGDQTRINERIRAPRVRVVTANGDQLGVMNTRDALEKAKALGLDLVEVAGNADPPVCRVVDSWTMATRSASSSVSAVVRTPTRSLATTSSTKSSRT